ncbi:hypothetical protein MYP_612 [Sporocytophaga myxococcoides]|uniref:Uncharacterized protein n=1 Tax=Sporocytophaga myxococcoides TaxID=153721 RepID=A0A098L933_9BACT|nr:hypothetical protein [Sporocytophaga myxococcoides]GAL83386.1 hypothetical protein MYP_612 [Sporocytophaga myxococcoides]
MEIEIVNEINNKELALALTQFYKVLYIDFGISNFNERISGWYNLTWEEFKIELENHSINFNHCLLNDWEAFFHIHKRKVLSLMNS